MINSLEKLLDLLEGNSNSSFSKRISPVDDFDINIEREVLDFEDDSLNKYDRYVSIEDEMDFYETIQNVNPLDQRDKETLFNFKFTFNRLLFYDRSNPYLPSFEIHEIFPNLPLPDLPGNLENIYQLAVDKLGLTAELLDYEQGKLNPNVLLSGKLSPFDQYNFISFFEKEFRHSFVGKSYFFNQPLVLLEGDRINSRNFIEERRFKIKLTNKSKIPESKKKLFSNNGMRIDTTLGEIYGFEELKIKSFTQYTSLMKEFNHLILNKSAKYVPITAQADRDSYDLLSLMNIR